MVQAKKGDTVKVHFTGKLKNGVPFDSSLGGEPLEFRIGDKRLISGFEEAVIGMSPGESKTVTLPPEKAYGPYSESKVVTVERKDLPEGVIPEVGLNLEVCAPSGEMIPVQIIEVTDKDVTLDANHPLSDSTLTFEIQLLEIEGVTGSGPSKADR